MNDSFTKISNNICSRWANVRKTAKLRTNQLLRDHGADIFSVLAGIGVIATGVSAYNAGRNAESGNSDNGKGMWKAHNLFVPVSFGSGTIGCIYAARKFGKLKEESLLAACSVLALYAKRKEQISGAESEIREPVGGLRHFDASNIESTDTGDILFIEDFTGRKFRTTWAAYEDAKRKLQEQFSISQSVVLNDFYELLGLEKTNAGEILGWTIDQMILDRFYDGETIPYEDALTQLCIEEDTDDDGNVVIYYCILPIGGLAGVGPCNY